MCWKGDVLVTGITRNFTMAYEGITRLLRPKDGSILFGMSILITHGKTVFFADTTVHELPTPEQLADIAIAAADKARQFGHEPRVALLSFSNFGNPMREKALRIREAVEVLNGRKVDFEYDGEMSADVALNKDLLALYPFCRLSAPANVLIMPALHSANIASKLLQELGGGTLIGPLLVGMEKPAQIVKMSASVSEILTIAALGATECE